MTSYIIGWSLQQNDVCFGARDNEYGTFTLQSNGKLEAIKLVNKSGHVTCDKNNTIHQSYWGCHQHPVVGHLVSIAVTDTSNKLIFPQGIHEYAQYGWMDARPQTSMSPELVLNDPAHSIVATKGMEMRLWYGEDFRDHTESDNDGRVCADVYAVIVVENCNVDNGGCESNCTMVQGGAM